jgi:hypothetical protein
VYANIPVERVAEYVRRLADGNVREKVAAARRLVYGVRCRVFFFNDVVWTGNVGKILSDLVILPNNNEKCYSNFSPQLFHLNTP